MRWPRRSKLNNAAATSIPVPPGPTTIHNYSTGWAGIIAVGFTCILALLPVGWFALVFLFKKMGGTEREAALLVVSIPVIGMAGWFLHWLVLAFLAESHSFRLEMERELTRREEIRLLGAQTAIEPGRMNQADYEYARVIMSVMEIAYNWLEKNKYDKFPGRWRPWSKNETLATAEKIGIPITHTQALSVAKDLASDGIITAADLGQISKDFPNLSSVRAHLDNKYGRPIISVAPTLRDNRGYMPIKS